MLNDVKKALGITGDYQDATLQIYIDEVIAFLRDAGVAESVITSGIVARGVSDLWNYGSGEGKLSQYFVQRAIQLSKQGGTSSSSGGGGGGGDLSNYYTKMETNALLYLKANVTDVYTKEQIDIALAGKADAADLNSKQDKTDNTLETDNKQIPSAINEVNSIAKGAQRGISYGDYETMITAFNALASTVYNVGQSVYIVTLDVPDLWISDIESGSVPYTYTTDEAFLTALQTDGYVQVGFYKLSALETGKVDLSAYYTKTQTDNLLSGKQNSLTAGDKITISNDTISADLSDYYDKDDTDALLAPKLTEPSSNLAVGKYFRIASIDNDGHAVLECVDAPSAPIQSVSVDGTAVTPDANGDVAIPTLSTYSVSKKYGLVKTAGIGTSGTRCYIDEQGFISVYLAYNQLVTSRNAGWILQCSQVDLIVKAAMTDGRGAAWTDAERLAALLRMGCTVDENGFVKWTSQE